MQGADFSGSEKSFPVAVAEKGAKEGAGAGEQAGQSDTDVKEPRRTVRASQSVCQGCCMSLA